MKEFFKRQNRLSAGSSDKGKKYGTFLLLLSILFFIPGAFAMWEFIYQLCNMIGAVVSGTPSQAIVQLKRVAPIMVTALTYAYIGVWLTDVRRAPRGKSRAGKWMRNGIVTIVLGAFSLLYPLVGLLTGEYESLVEGNPSLLFPLDILIGGAFFVLIGVLAICNGRAIKENGDPLSPSAYGHFHIEGFPYAFSYMVALGSFAACVYSVYVVDWTHGDLFFNIALVLNYFTAFLMAVVYRFVYTELKDEYKPKARRDLGLLFFVVNLILLVLYVVALQIENEAPDQNAFGLLPIDFTASFHAFLPLFALNNLLAPLTAFIKGLVSYAKQKRKARHNV